MALDEVFPGSLPYWLEPIGDHYYSVYPVGVALVALPFELGAVLAGHRASEHDHGRIEVVAASTVGALGTLALYLLLRTAAGPGWAAMLTGLFAFGSAQWSTSSGNLWQHGPGGLAISVALLATLRAPGRPAAALVAGAAIGVAVLVRPLNAIWLVAIAAMLPRASLVRYAIGGAPFAIALVAYNLAVYGSPIGGYDSVARVSKWSLASAPEASPRTSSARAGVSWPPLPTSSSRPWGPGASSRRFGASVGWIAAAALAHLAVVSAWGEWWGGWCFGPRFTTELLPALFLALAPLAPVLARRPILAAVFIVLAAISIPIPLPRRRVGGHPVVERVAPTSRATRTGSGALGDAQVLAPLRYRPRSFPARLPVAWFGDRGGELVLDGDRDRDEPPPAHTVTGRPAIEELVRLGRPGQRAELVTGTAVHLPPGRWAIGFELGGRSNPPRRTAVTSRSRTPRRWPSRPGISRAPRSGATRSRSSWSTSIGGAGSSPGSRGRAPGRGSVWIRAITVPRGGQLGPVAFGRPPARLLAMIRSSESTGTSTSSMRTRIRCLGVEVAQAVG